MKLRLGATMPAGPCREASPSARSCRKGIVFKETQSHAANQSKFPWAHKI